MSAKGPSNAVRQVSSSTLGTGTTSMGRTLPPSIGAKTGVEVEHAPSIAQTSTQLDRRPVRAISARSRTMPPRAL
jgi:hypothetical protein